MQLGIVVLHHVHVHMCLIAHVFYKHTSGIRLYKNWPSVRIDTSLHICLVRAISLGTCMRIHVPLNVCLLLWIHAFKHAFMIQQAGKIFDLVEQWWIYVKIFFFLDIVQSFL